MKQCSKCKTLRGLDEFYADKRATDGKQSQCKKCERAAARGRDHSAQYKKTGREAHFRRKYGIALWQYDALVKRQNGKCAGCGLDPGSTPLYVDHDHKTGHVRGLLCNECNRALGLIRDNPATLRRLADYLEVRVGSAEQMLRAMRSLLGVSGRPNVVTRDYAREHGDEFLRAPWCDMAITYAARRSGNDSAVLPEGDRAYTVAHAQDGKDLGRWHAGTAANIKAHAEPGAIVFFDWDGTDTIGRIDHVGIVEKNLGDGRVQSIEGNSGDACKRRVRAANVIAGFWNPDYEGEDMPSAKEVADAVYERFTHTIPEDAWAARKGLLDPGQKIDPRSAFRQIWAYGKDGYNRSREILARLDAQTATIKALAEALAARDATVDADALVQRIREEIDNITVHLDAGPAGD